MNSVQLGFEQGALHGKAAWMNRGENYTHASQTANSQ
jgi:hypothetical protein